MGLTVWNCRDLQDSVHCTYPLLCVHCVHTPCYEVQDVHNVYNIPSSLVIPIVSYLHVHINVSLVIVIALMYNWCINCCKYKNIDICCDRLLCYIVKCKKQKIPWFPKCDQIGGNLELFPKLQIRISECNLELRNVIWNFGM